MIRWFLRRQIAAFERAWNYDAAYLYELIDTDPRAMHTFGKVQYLTKYRKDIPVAAYCAAGLIAVMAEDCGPCTQLGIDMAQREGLDPAILRAIVARDYVAMPEEVALAARFTEASMYPTLKYALGHGQACTRLVIGGQAAPVQRELARENIVRTKTAAA